MLHTRRLLTCLLALALAFAAAVPAFASETRPLKVADIYRPNYVTTRLTDAIMDMGSYNNVFFYSDPGLTNKISDEIRLSEATQFWARADDLSKVSEVVSFWVYISETTMSLTVDYTDVFKPIKLTATVKRESGRPRPTGYVEFRENGVILGAVQLNSSGKATISFSPAITGGYTCHAEYLGDDNYQKSSAFEQVVVGFTAASSDAGASAAALSPEATAFSENDVLQMAKDAITLASNQGKSTATLTVYTSSIIPRTLLRSMENHATANGVTLQVYFDRLSDSGGVLTRLYASFGPQGVAGEGLRFTPRADLSGGDIDEVKSVFGRYFANKVTVAGLAQTGGYGYNAHFALAMNLDGMATNDLRFYLYNRDANSFVPISGHLDSAGFTHVETEKGGYVVVSEGALKS